MWSYSVTCEGEVEEGLAPDSVIPWRGEGEAKKQGNGDWNLFSKKYALKLWFKAARKKSGNTQNSKLKESTQKCYNFFFLNWGVKFPANFEKKF